MVYFFGWHILSCMLEWHLTSSGLTGSSSSSSMSCSQPFGRPYSCLVGKLLRSHQWQGRLEDWWALDCKIGSICMRDWIVSKHSNTSNAKYCKGGPHLMTIMNDNVSNHTNSGPQRAVRSGDMHMSTQGKMYKNQKHSKTTTIVPLFLV